MSIHFSFKFDLLKERVRYSPLIYYLNKKKNTIVTEHSFLYEHIHESTHELGNVCFLFRMGYVYLYLGTLLPCLVCSHCPRTAAICYGTRCTVRVCLGNFYSFYMFQTYEEMFLNVDDASITFSVTVKGGIVIVLSFYFESLHRQYQF